MKLPKLTNLYYVLSTLAIIVFIVSVFSLGAKTQCQDINKSDCEFVAFWQPSDF